MLPPPLNSPIPVALTTEDSREKCQHTNQTIMPLWLVEKEAIEQAIAICEGNIPKAAALLQVSPSTVYRKRLSWQDAEPHNGHRHQ